MIFKLPLRGDEREKEGENVGFGVGFGFYMVRFIGDLFFRFRSFSDEFCGISVCLTCRFQRHCVEMNVYGNLFIIYIYARFKNCLN